jgi:quercetin dioxygenase-like cupin family protein
LEDIILKIKLFMTSRRKLFKLGSLGLLPFILPSFVFSKYASDFEGIVVNENDGEAFRLRDGRALVKIKISKRQGAASMSVLTSTVPTKDAIHVHKHLNEDEIFFIRQGTGIFTLGENEHSVTAGSIIFIPKGIWHGLKNTGTEEIATVFGYSPAGFEDFFKELGTAVDKPFVEKSTEERKAIAKKWGMVYKE